MKTRFIAIGVGQGDAFFLERAGKTVLIDGGRSSQHFPFQFKNVTKRKSVDILVCTHNDADHAKGVLGFLLSGLKCKEVWLPGSWTDRFEDILLDPIRLTRELIRDIEKAPERGLSLQALGDRYLETMEYQGEDRSLTPDVLHEILEKASEIDCWWDIWFYHGMWRSWLGSDEKLRLFTEALSAASLIREISLAAYHAGALIRWFEYDDQQAGGGIPGFLVPLNAREVFQFRVGRWSPLRYISLTRSNKQSLVFITPASDEEPAVLFTADSDLSFKQTIPWSDGMVVTAPHHGSEDNANAYKRFTSEANNLDVIWVRSDGRFESRPGSSYLNVRGNRFCTICRGSTYPKQDIHLTIATQKWTPVRKTRSCRCA